MGTIFTGKNKGKLYEFIIQRKEGKTPSELVADLKAENAQLKAEAQFGNIPYKEAIRLKEENESLKKKLGEKL